MELTLGDNIARIAHGDEEAVGWLYDTCSPVLYRRLLNCGRIDDGDDASLLHDAFAYCLRENAHVLRLFLERTDEAEHTSAVLRQYLWRITYGIANHEPAPEAHWPNGDDAEGETAPTQAHLLEVDAALRRHSTRLFLYFKLRYLDGLSDAQIAEITGWSPPQTPPLHAALCAFIDGHEDDGEGLAPEELLWRMSTAKRPTLTAHSLDDITLQAYRQGTLLEAEHTRTERLIGDDDVARQRLSMLANTAPALPPGEIRERLMESLVAPVPPPAQAPAAVAQATEVLPPRTPTTAKPWPWREAAALAAVVVLLAVLGQRWLSA